MSREVGRNVPQAMRARAFFVVVFFLSFTLCSRGDQPVDDVEFDSSGYVVYCPCMGRFGNQADHFLGSLSFAKALNRTLVLPHWIVHKPPRSRGPTSVMIPFDSWFSVAPLRAYHRVILLKDFIRNVAPVAWPPGNRTAFCYSSRAHFDENAAESTDGGCNAKNGNPFGPFWDSVNVEFDSSEFFGPLSFDAHRPTLVERWKTAYPPDKWPVLAFVGAPASFPVQAENVELQKYLQWNERMTKAAEDFMRINLPKGPVVGIHLRNGVDWSRACEHVKPRDDDQPARSLFSSPQCVGYRNEKGSLTSEMCLPSTETVVKDVKKAVKRTKAVSVFVATDSDPLVQPLTKALSRSSKSSEPIVVLTSSSISSVDGIDDELERPQLDLAILGRVNHFVGNCVSSFSAFVRRDRDVNGFPSSWFAFPPVNPKKRSKARASSPAHEEL